MVEHGLEDVEPEEGEPLSFAHVVGARCRFVQVKDEEAMKRSAKNAAKSKGRINAQGQHLDRADEADFYRRVGTLGRVLMDIETEAFALPA